MLVFGPVPSRRLGRSLGINNIPYKYCSYACLYCQLGAKTNLTLHRRAFYKPEDIVEEVARRLEKLKQTNETVDYISIVPDGEPTLDKNLGILIDKLKVFGLRVAVITNASLLYLPEVRQDLLAADWISIKIDTVNFDVWKKLNRPHHELNFDTFLEGILAFSEEYKNTLTTETMLVNAINDFEDNLCKTSMFISQLNPSVAYIAAPIRPPAFQWVKKPNIEKITEAYNIFSEYIERVELIIKPEGNEFVLTDDFQNDLLSIISVHPISEESLKKLLNKYNKDFSAVERLINSKLVKIVDYQGKNFFIRNFY